MCSKNNKGSIPRTPIKNELQALRDELEATKLAFASIGFRILYAHDILEHAGIEVQRRGRMTPQLKNDIGVQMVAYENIMRNVLNMTSDIVSKYRENYLQDEFNASVLILADQLAPLIITSTNVKPRGKFSLEN